jgi:hypothetical protein
MKNFKFWAIALVAALGFSSCSKDGEQAPAACAHDFIEYDYTQDLVGTWTCMDMDYAEAMVIKADGSVEVTGVVDHEFFQSKGTIKVVNNKMIYKLDNGDEWEGRFEMTKGESFSMIWDDELDIRYTYRYCENDLADEVVGMWVCNNGPLEGVQTFKADGTSLMTGMTPVGGVLNHESTYKVVGDLMFCMMPEGYDLRYSCARIVYRPNGTALGDVMIHQSINVTDDFEVEESSLTWLRVKQYLNIAGKAYDYSNIYISDVKGLDKDIEFMGYTMNFANMDGLGLDKMLKSLLFAVEFPDANTISYSYQMNGNKETYNVPIAVDGNKIVIKMSEKVASLKDVEFLAFQDADDSQMHFFMHKRGFVNFYTNMQAMLTKAVNPEFDINNAEAVNAIYDNINNAVETINVSLVMSK